MGGFATYDKGGGVPGTTVYADNFDFTGTGRTNTVTLNGQLPIGSTAANAGGNHINIGTLTSPLGTVSIGYSSPNITLDIVGGGFTWTDVTTATKTLAAQNGYVTDRGGGVTYTLPATGTLGDEIRIVGKLGLTTIAQNANQQIVFGSSSTTVGVTGSVAGTNVGDCMTLICITSGASTVWRISDAVGNLTVT